MNVKDANVSTYLGKSTFVKQQIYTPALPFCLRKMPRCLPTYLGILKGREWNISFAAVTSHPSVCPPSSISPSAHRPIRFISHQVHQTLRTP